MASIVIIAVSAALMFCWFRYVCVLLLHHKDPDDAAGEQLQKLMNSDARLLRELVGRSKVDPLERRLLLCDYQLLRIWHRLTGARSALVEMGKIVHFFSRAAEAETSRG